MTTIVIRRQKVNVTNILFNHATFSSYVENNKVVCLFRHSHKVASMLINMAPKNIILWFYFGIFSIYNFIQVVHKYSMDMQIKIKNLQYAKHERNQ